MASLGNEFEPASLPAPRPHYASGEYRPVDEMANLITHGLGFVLSLIASVALMSLVIAGGRSADILACGIYCSTLIALYAASTLSHMFHDLAWRRFFRMLDQACIFLLIAGSFTPFAVVYLMDGWWPLLLVAMWTLAIAGVMLVLRTRNLSTAARVTYGLLGWLPAIALYKLATVASPEVLIWVLAGGAFYSTGTLFLRYDGFARYMHALWHIFVIGGSTCHYVAILLIAVLRQ